MGHQAAAARSIQRDVASIDEQTAARAREQQVNDTLRGLDEDHRQRRIQRDEYRQRRRALLESLGSEASRAGRDTVRRAVPASNLQQQDAKIQGDDGGEARTFLKSSRAFDASRLVEGAAVLGAIAIGIMLLYWLVFT